MNTKKLITQHRRGTKTEWENTLEVPKDGEVIIEKGSIPKVKVGNGNSPFIDLPYITDEVEAKIETQKQRIDNIAGEGNPLEGSWEKELQDIRVVGDKTYPCAGDAVRGIYDDVKDFVGKSAVNGLEYNQNGDYMLYLTSNGNRVGDGVEVKGGNGDGPSSNRLVVRFQEGTSSDVFVLADAKDAYLNFIFEGYDSAGDKISTISGEWRIDDKNIAYQTILFGDNSFNIKPFLETKTQKVELIVNDATGKSTNKIWTIQQLELSIKALTDDLAPYPVNKDLTFDFEPTGAIQKTLHVELDDTPLILEPSESNLSQAVSGYTRSFTIPAKYMKHGSHRVNIYLEAIINNKFEYSTIDTRDILVFDENEESVKAVIGTNVTETSIEQYGSFQIRYTVYQPKVNNPQVTIYVDGKEVKNQILSDDNHTDHYTFTSNEVGTHRIAIRCGLITKNVTIEVKKLLTPLEPVIGTAFDFRPLGKSNSDIDRLWADANNTDIKMEVSPNFDWINGGYTFDKDSNGNYIPGSEHFLIKAGTTATITYNLFGNDISNTGKEVKIIFKTTNISNTATPCISCLADNIGFEMTPHEARIHDSVDTLKLAYSDSDIIEFEFNIAKAKDAVPMVIGYEDGVATRALIMSSASRFQQLDNNQKAITIGCSDCDVHIYRFKVYERSLSDRDILNNFIADARTSAEIKNRYIRNQIFDENGKLTPDSVAKACPGLRVYKLSAPQFTSDKDESIPNTRIEQIFYPEDGSDLNPVEYNWVCTGAEHSGQGTSSNDYGKAGRNLDFKMNVDDAKITLADGTPVSKIQLSPNSVPTNYLNMKVNIASSNNMTNALLAKLYNEYGRKIYARPLIRESDYEYDVKDTMEFHNAVVFVQETDLLNVDGKYSNHREFNDTEYHFYAIGNIGDSKKTDKTRLNDPNDPYECCIEIVDVGKPLSDFPVDTMYPACTENKDKETGKITYSWLPDLSLDILYEKNSEGNYELTTDTEIDYTAYNKYYVDILEYDPINKKYTYDWRYCSNKKDSSITKVCKRAWIQFYRFITQSSDQDFVTKFNDYMIKDSALFNYLFTLRYCMVDNRAKNTFWHFAKTGEFHQVENPHKDLLPIYYEDVAGDYVLTSDIDIIEGKVYYSQHAFDLTWDYDNDTALGLNNYGQQVYRYGYEEPDKDEYGEEIFRESDSTFYLRIRELFKDELKEMYGSNKLTILWNAENLISLADNMQNEFPEALWRTDIERKYIRTYTEAFIDQAGDAQFLTRMCNGKMKYHRRQWERNQANYMASKFIPSLASSKKVTMRLKGKSESSTVDSNYTFKIKPYSYSYINVSYDNTNTIYDPIRVENLDEEITVYKPSNVESPDIINIFNAEALSSIGDLSTFYPETLTVSDAIHLTEVKLGSNTTGYMNSGFTTFDAKGNPLLTKIDIRNIPSLTGSLDLSSLIKLEQLYAKGTSLTAIEFADGGKLDKVEFPATITSLEFTNLQYLTDSDISIENDNFANITSLKIINCPKINIDTLLSKCSSKLTEVHLTNLEWNLVGYDSNAVKEYFEETYGKYNTCYLEGILNVSFIEGADYTWIKSKYPDIKINYNQMSCTVVFKSQTEEELYTVNRYKDPETVINIDNPVPSIINSPQKDSTEEYDFTFIGWSTLKESETLPLVNPLDNIEGYVEVYPVYEKSVRNYTITFKTGNEVLYSIQLPALINDEKYYPEFDYELVTNSELLLDNAPKNISSKSPSNYTFIGWSPEISYVTSDITYNAIFAIDKYDTITIEDIEYTVNENNKTLSITGFKTDKVIIRLPKELEISENSYSVSSIVALPSNYEFEALDMSETSITTIPQGFVWNMTSLQELKLPDNLKKLDFRCLNNIGISFIDIPETVNTSGSIGYVAFGDCKNLQEVWIRTTEPSASLFSSTNGYSIFNDCPNLSDIYVGWNELTSVNGTGNRWGATNATIHYNTKFNG